MYKKRLIQVLVCIFIIKLNISAETNWKKILDNVSGSIVKIKVMKISQGKDTEYASGSGFIISYDGTIITNKHVIEKAYQYPARYGIKILQPNKNEEEYTAQILAVSSEKDLAQLKIYGTFDPCVLGNSENLQLMDNIMVVGYPLTGAFKVTQGTLQAFQEDEDNEQKYLDLSTQLAPGNSGGPVFDKNGNVVGIATATIIGYNFNLAIPINDVKDFIDSVTLKSVTIQSTPEDADIFIDNVLIGKTPFQAKISNNNTELKILQEMKEPIEVLLDSSIKNNSTLKYQLEKLDRQEYQIVIHSTPANGIVYVDGKKIGKTPCEITVIGNQKFTVEIEKRRYELHKKVYSKKNLPNNTIEVNLKKK
ncbi:MAG: trypsin-like peptidase domain-containing protein [Spirochaetes bacterium]|nr:trypsin-like peptidase domain-containing protein [Spirochaetota bacterium]